MMNQASAAAALLTKKDVAIGTAMAVAMATLFAFLSSGASLLVTFVPGVAGAWLLMFWMYRTGVALPTPGAFAPAFLLTLSVQLLHFAEEYLTGFNASFPALYGGAAYSQQLFVTFNMIAYAAFTIAFVAAFFAGLRFLLFPVLFFTIYGVLGNAISHSWWSVSSLAYFPGLYTAQLYWIAAPLLLFRLVRSPRAVAVVMIGTAALLIPLLTVFAVR